MITGISYEEFLKMLEYVFDKQYNWLLIDRDNNRVHIIKNLIN